RARLPSVYSLVHAVALVFMYSSRSSLHSVLFFLFFFVAATSDFYTLSLHDALPIFSCPRGRTAASGFVATCPGTNRLHEECSMRSEEHTSELQSHLNLVCRLLLEKKNGSLRQEHVTVSIVGYCQSVST